MSFPSLMMLAGEHDVGLCYSDREGWFVAASTDSGSDIFPARSAREALRIWESRRSLTLPDALHRLAQQDDHAVEDARP